MALAGLMGRVLESRGAKRLPPLSSTLERTPHHASRLDARTADHAAEAGYGIPAFNVNNLEQVQAVMAAADEVGAPVILQASAGARKYAGESFIKHLIAAASEAYPHIPLVMHQDHGTSRHLPGRARPGLWLGDDGRLAAEDGKTPSDFAYNVDVTRQVVAMAHRIGATVEGELGCLGSSKPAWPARKMAWGAEGKLEPFRAADRPRGSRAVRQGHAARRAGHCHRHQPWRLQVHAPAHGRRAGHQPRQGKSMRAFPTPTW